MSTKVQLSGGGFQDASGNLLADGYLLMALSQDGAVNGVSQLAAGVELKITLDQNGNVSSSPAQYVWPNDVISPSNTFYTVSAYTSEGQLVWGPNSQQVLSSPSPFDTGGWVPGVINIVAPQLFTVYDIGTFYPSVIPGSAIVTIVPLERGVKFAIGLTPSVAYCGTSATSNYSFSLQKNGVQFGTLTFNAGSNVGVFVSSGGASFIAGDVLKIIAASTPDVSLADVGIVLSGVVA